VRRRIQHPAGTVTGDEIGFAPVYVRDLANEWQFGPFLYHCCELECVGFSSDGSKLITLGRDHEHTIAIWDLATATPTKVAASVRQLTFPQSADRPIINFSLMTTSFPRTMVLQFCWCFQVLKPKQAKKSSSPAPLFVVPGYNPTSVERSLSVAPRLIRGTFPSGLNSISINTRTSLSP
jgi:hypothetical protein